MFLRRRMKMASKTKPADKAAATAASTKEKATKTAKAATKTAAKTIEKQPEEKKAVKKPACKTSVCVEMSGLSVSVTDIQNAVKKALKEKGLEAADLKIYVNAAEQAAYYTVDGEGGESYKVNLNDL